MKELIIVIAGLVTPMLTDVFLMPIEWKFAPYQIVMIGFILAWQKKAYQVKNLKNESDNLKDEVENLKNEIEWM